MTDEMFDEFISAKQLGIQQDIQSLNFRYNFDETLDFLSNLFLPDNKRHN